MPGLTQFAQLDRNSTEFLRFVFVLVDVIGFSFFGYVVARRLMPLLHGECDKRFDRVWDRLRNVIKFYLAQWKHPRYSGAGTLHIIIFVGFLVLLPRSLSLLWIGISWPPEATPTLVGPQLYGLVKDGAATLVLAAVIACAVRRLVFNPPRYQASGDLNHGGEAVLVLTLIAILMLSESLFSASHELLSAMRENIFGPSPWLLSELLEAHLHRLPVHTLATIRLAAYLLHDLTFFVFLCFLPFGKHFHVVTSFFEVAFAKLDRGMIKPVRWDVPDNKLDKAESFGVKTFKDFTWKHILDFYSCADCGRCSDNCPANAAGRPLSPRFLTTKARNYVFQHFPVFGQANNGTPLIGSIYSEDEIWSCTTCAACEEECPLLVEYIDKIVDLRRGMIDDGKVPQSLQKPLKAIESRGNPYGKMEKKRADWARAADFQKGCKVKVCDKGVTAESLYFVDSISSYDERMQSIARSTAKILSHAGEEFGILGAAEKDSGHDVRRFGEETLFMVLREQNTEAIRASGVQRIVTADPHAFNALKHDYQDLPPVEHISQFIAREFRSGRIQFSAVGDTDKVYTYHDPCYLGRHNLIYEEPREILDSIPGLKRVEMKRSRDRSFCCGGGGLMLFYEPKEEERIGVKRVRMAAEAGANVIVTACPFCMVNIEDAIKVAGFEGQMSVIDLAELADRQMAREAVTSEGIPKIQQQCFAG